MVSPTFWYAKNLYRCVFYIKIRGFLSVLIKKYITMWSIKSHGDVYHDWSIVGSVIEIGIIPSTEKRPTKPRRIHLEQILHRLSIKVLLPLKKYNPLSFRNQTAFGAFRDIILDGSNEFSHLIKSSSHRQTLCLSWSSFTWILERFSQLWVVNHLSQIPTLPSSHKQKSSSGKFGFEWEEFSSNHPKKTSRSVSDSIFSQIDLESFF